jgi:hypothetical protein
VANVTTIPTYRWLPLSLSMELCWDFMWWFVVADITHPLIGINFLLDCQWLLYPCSIVFSVGILYIQHASAMLLKSIIISDIKCGKCSK